MDLVALVIGAILGGVMAGLFTAYTVMRRNAGPDAASWLMGGFGLALVFGGARNATAPAIGAGIGLLAVSAYGLWLNQQWNVRRDRAAITLAGQLGLRSSKAGVGPRVTLLVESLEPGLEHSAQHKFERLLVGNYHGTEVKVFEYRYWIAAGGVHTQHPFVCAIAETPSVPNEIQIRPATGTGLRAIFRKASVDLGDGAFQKVFMVHSDDPVGAQTRLDSRIRSWLTANGKGMSFLIGRDSVLGMTPRGSRTPSAVLDTVLAFRAELYPNL